MMCLNYQKHQSALPIFDRLKNISRELQPKNRKHHMSWSVNLLICVQRRSLAIYKQIMLSFFKRLFKFLSSNELLLQL